jgi:hypothetical protein
VAGTCEHGNKPSNSVKGGGFIDWLDDCQKDSATWDWFVQS